MYTFLVKVVNPYYNYIIYNIHVMRIESCIHCIRLTKELPINTAVDSKTIWY